MTGSVSRRRVLAGGAVLAVAGAFPFAARAQNKVLLRISTPAVPEDWHAKMWTVMKEQLDKTTAELDRIKKRLSEKTP